MSAQIFYNNGSSSSEIITHLVNASDGQGLHFEDGARINLSNSAGSEFGTSDFSIEFILNQSGDNTHDNWIYYTHNAGNNRMYFLNDISANNIKITFFNNSGASTVYTLAYDMSADYGTPTHYVLSFDRSGNVELFKNANSVATDDISGSSAIDLGSGNATDGLIGVSSAGYTVLGTFYRFRTWNRKLESADVTSVYESASIDFADQWGSQTSLVDAAASVFTSGVYNWTKYGNNTIANVSNTLAITYVGGSMAEYGAYNMLADSSDLTTNLVVGKKYRVTFDAKYTGGSAGPLPQVYNGSAYINGIALTTSLVTQSIEFTAEHATNGFIRLSGMSAGNVVTIDNWYVRAIGVSADFDLAFANPTQSTIVQDRAGVADGTAAGGVTQISPIEAVNTNKLNVSGTTPRVGIGLAAGTAPASPLVVSGTSKAVSYTPSDATLDIQGSSTGHLLFGTDINSPYGAWINTDVESQPLLLMAAGGNVGIGLSAPDTALHIFKDLHNAAIATPDASSSYQLHINGAAGSTNDTVGMSMSCSNNNDNISASMVAIDTGSAGIADLAFSTRGSGGIAERLRIDNAGKVSVGTPSDGFLNVRGSESSTYAAKLINSSSQGWGALVFGGADADDYSLRVVNKDDVDLLVVKGNGSTFVKRPEWPLKNELSNSGFDCWSNSTFENTGSDLIDNGDFASASDWGVSTGAWVIGSGVATFTTGSGTSILSQGSLGTTSGKLYRLTFTVGTATATIAITNASASGTLVAEADYAVGAHTVVYEDVGNNDIAFTSSGGNSYTLDNVSLHEGVPKCIATGDKGPDRWAKSSSLDLTRIGFNTTNIKGMYGCLMTTGSTNAEELHQPAYPERGEQSWYNKFRGRTVTFGCWLYADSDASNGAQAYIRDQDGYSYATKVAANTLTWVEVTRTVSTTAWSSIGQFLTVGIMYECGIAAKNCYVSQPMLVFGSAIGSGNYSRPSGEIVNCETVIPSAAIYGNGFSDVAKTTLNVEVDTLGRLPKGAKAIIFNGEMRDSGSAAGDSYMYFTNGSDQNGTWVSSAGLANDKYGRNNGTQFCSEDGDISYVIEATGSGTADIFLKYQGVQLR